MEVEISTYKHVDLSLGLEEFKSLVFPPRNRSLPQLPSLNGPANQTHEREICPNGFITAPVGCGGP